MQRTVIMAAIVLCHGCAAYAGLLGPTIDETNVFSMCGVEYARNVLPKEKYMAIIDHGWLFSLGISSRSTTKDFAYNIFVAESGLVDCFIGRYPTWSTSVGKPIADKEGATMIVREMASSLGLTFGGEDPEVVYSILFVPKVTSITNICDSAVYRIYSGHKEGMVIRKKEPILGNIGYSW